MDHPTDLQDPDESRPAKRVRLEAPLDVTEDTREEMDDDLDDFYGDSGDEKEENVTNVKQDVSIAPKSPDSDNGDFYSCHSEEHDVEYEELTDVKQDVSTTPPSLDLTAPTPSVTSSFVTALPGLGMVGSTNGVKAGSGALSDLADEPPYVEEKQTQPAEPDSSIAPAEEPSDLHEASGVSIASADIPVPPNTKSDPAPGQADGSEAHTQKGVTTTDEKSMTEEAVGNAPAEEVQSNGDEKTESHGDVQLRLNATTGQIEAAEDGAEVLVDVSKPEKVDLKDNAPTAEVPMPRSKHDSEFMEAAQAQKGSEDAEWRFDSSDGSVSSSDVSSDSSSDEDSDDEGYEMLDADTAAKYLMAEEGDEDGENKRANANYQPRTLNEQPEVVVPKPDVTVTPEMKITFLGVVDNIVENMVLITASTSGEYQVLESGSVLCLENREIIGAVQEPLGKVQQPLYSVAFTNPIEIEKAGVSHGTKIFYVDAHTTFVFTQPLKNLKGTDASNIHDEEVAEDEMEFSDDEAEAAYKREKKLAKRGGRGGFSAQTGRGGFGGQSNSNHNGQYDRGPAYDHDGGVQNHGGAMNYDDEEDGAEEMYTPLKRPDNLPQLMAGGAPPIEERTQRPAFDRGRGRGRGGDRGRGGRGRGDRGDRGRGGRGGRGDSSNRRGGQNGINRGGQDGANQRQGPARTFPDAHNNEPRGPREQPLPPRPTWSPANSGQKLQRNDGHQLQNYQQGYQQPTSYQQPQQQQQQTYQFNGHTFQYGQPPPTPAANSYQPPAGAYVNPYALPSPTPATNIYQPPAGAYVNPAFYRGPQLQNQWPQQQPASGGSNAQQYQQYAPPAQAASNGQQATDLADILKRLRDQGSERPR